MKDDVISRQAAIDAVSKGCQEWRGIFSRCEANLLSLPTAQPDLQPTCNQLATDCISRQVAITAIQKAYCDTEGGEDKYAVWKNVGLTEALHIMQDLPSAQPERKNRKWIHDGYDIPHGVDWMHCSECGRREPHVPAAMTNFCPNCGADMRGEQDGTD